MESYPGGGSKAGLSSIGSHVNSKIMGNHVSILISQPFPHLLLHDVGLMNLEQGKALGMSHEQVVHASHIRHSTRRMQVTYEEFVPNVI